MINREEHSAAAGKLGALKVKSMIAAVEQKMADGETVSAGPANEAEAKQLQTIREENRASADRAGGR